MGRTKKLSSNKKGRLTNRLNKILKKEKLSYKDIGRKLNVDYNTARLLVRNLRNSREELHEDILDNRKYFWIPTSPLRENLTKEFTLDKSGSGWRKLGLVSDTHMNSKYEADTELQQIYDTFADESIELVAHAGDLTDGNGRMYRGHLNEINRYGYQNILDDTIRRYPKRDSMASAVISGNHDMSFWKSEGADIIREFANRRDDIKYLGQLSAIMEIDGLKTYLVHADGGMPYARSYKIQKMVEQMHEKPDLLFRGHLHVAMYLPYIGVHNFESGCFQKQTPYLARKGLHPEVGGWIIEFKMDKFGNLEEIKPRWLDYGSGRRSRGS